MTRPAPMAVICPALATLAPLPDHARAQPGAAAETVAPEPPALQADFIRGVNHAHVHRRGHGYGSDRSAQELRQLHDLGVNWVALTPFGYQHGATADRIVGFPGREGRTEFFQGTDPTLTDEDLAHEIAAAQRLGMKVLIKPHIWSHDFWGGNQWHGTVRQTSPAAHARWWASYRAFTLHYARLAQRSGADAFCLGTELVLMTRDHPDEWRQLAEDVRAVFDGPITCAAHWDDELEHITFWDALDAVGVTAYFPLDAPVGATVDELVAAWQPHRARLAAVAERTGRPIVFAEVGYRPVADAHREPWRHDGGERDDAAQARAYEAMFRALHDARWWRGVFLWKTFTDPAHPHRRGRLDFIFRDLPAESTIHRWFAAATPPPSSRSPEPPGP